MTPITTAEQFLEAVCEARGVETPCPSCGGLGTTVYGCTSTWQGGVGGQTPTNDVCNKCWGSGDTNKPWPSRRVQDFFRKVEIGKFSVPTRIHEANLQGYSGNSLVVDDPLNMKEAIGEAADKVKEWYDKTVSQSQDGTTTIFQPVRVRAFEPRPLDDITCEGDSFKKKI